MARSVPGKGMREGMILTYFFFDLDVLNRICRALHLGTERQDRKGGL